MMRPYTVTLTSCARFDLLERTLRSLLPRLEGPCERIVIGEDGGDRRVFDVVQEFSASGLRIDVLLNPRRLGIARNIDRIYSEVRTDWIFHCEDDWEFFRGGFIRESFEVMEGCPSISMVGLRNAAALRRGSLEPDIRVAGTARYRLSDPGISGAFAGMGFNPGLRRLADYKVVGPYGALAFAATETHVAEAYSALEYRAAHLVDPAVRHLGDGRQVGDAAKPRGLHHRLHRSLRKRILRLKWKIRPETHPVAKARNRRRDPGRDRCS